MKYLYTRCGKQITIDDDQYDKLKSYKWQLMGKKSVIATSKYVKNQVGDYFISHIKRIPITNEIMELKDVMFDHKDRNIFNCLKSNLRPATITQNICNRRKFDGCRSQYKGLSWNWRNKKWCVRAYLNKKCYFLGYFVDEIQAAKVYDKKARELHGEFAALNFPNENQF